MNAAMKTYGAKWGARDSFFNANKLSELNREKQIKKNMEGKNMSNTSIISANNAAITYETDNGTTVQLSPEIIRKYLVKENESVTDQEVYLFLELCKYQKINPFLREAYLIKYGNNPAQMVCGKELFTKRAENHPDFDGYEAGVMVYTKDNKIQSRPGTTYLPKFGETLIGGWAKVYRKKYKMAFEATAMFEEYTTSKSMWAAKPATMIRKVALVQALREAFPDMYGGLYSQEEIPVDGEKLPQEPVVPTVPDDKNKTIDEETQNYLCEQFNKDVVFAKKILLEFGYKKVIEVKQSDLDKILSRIEEEKTAGIISETQHKLLFAKAGKELIDKVIYEFGYDSVKEVKKKDFDEILETIMGSITEPNNPLHSNMMIVNEDGSITDAVTGNIIAERGSKEAEHMTQYVAEKFSSKNNNTDDNLPYDDSLPFKSDDIPA